MTMSDSIGDTENVNKDATIIAELNKKLRMEEDSAGIKENDDKSSETTCKDCNKTYKTRYHLNRHRLIHTGEKP